MVLMPTQSHDVFDASKIILAAMRVQTAEYNSKNN